jgi:hypothetical protein
MSNSVVVFGSKTPLTEAKFIFLPLLGKKTISANLIVIVFDGRYLLVLLYSCDL